MTCLLLYAFGPVELFILVVTIIAIYSIAKAVMRYLDNRKKK